MAYENSPDIIDEPAIQRGGPFDTTIARLAMAAKRGPAKDQSLIPAGLKTDALIALQRLGYDVAALGDPAALAEKLENREYVSDVQGYDRLRLNQCLDEVGALSAKVVWPEDKSPPLISTKGNLLNVPTREREGIVYAAAIEYRVNMIADMLGINAKDAEQRDNRVRQSRETLELLQQGKSPV